MLNGRFANLKDKAESISTLIVREFHDYLFNQQELLFQKLRQENSISYYSYYSYEKDYFPKNIFNISTNKANANKSIKLVVETISKIVNKGITDDEFKDFVDEMIEMSNVNFDKYQNLDGIGEVMTDIIDENVLVKIQEVVEVIKSMTSKQFNALIKNAYKKSPMYIIMDGDFDSEKLINIDLLTARINYKEYTLEQIKQIPKFASPDQKTTNDKFLFGDEIEFELDKESINCRKIVNKKMFSSDEMLQAHVDEVTEYLESQGFSVVDEEIGLTIDDVSEKLLNLKMDKKEKSIEQLNEKYANFLHLISIIKDGTEVVTKQKYKQTMLKFLAEMGDDFKSLSSKIENDEEIIKTKKNRNPLEIESKTL